MKCLPSILVLASPDSTEAAVGAVVAAAAIVVVVVMVVWVARMRLRKLLMALGTVVEVGGKHEQKDEIIEDERQTTHHENADFTILYREWPCLDNEDADAYCDHD